MRKDFQRSRVYKWENSIVAPFDLRIVPVSQLQAIVDYVWKAEGLEYSPIIKEMKDKRFDALADRMNISVNKKGIPTWVLLHELSHSMTSNFDGINDGHGKFFLGTYINLLTKYLGIDKDYLVDSAKHAGLVYNIRN